MQQLFLNCTSQKPQKRPLAENLFRNIHFQYSNIRSLPFLKPYLLFEIYPPSRSSWISNIPPSHVRTSRAYWFPEPRRKYNLISSLACVESCSGAHSSSHSITRRATLPRSFSWNIQKTRVIGLFGSLPKTEYSKRCTIPLHTYSRWSLLGRG